MSRPAQLSFSYVSPQTEAVGLLRTALQDGPVTVSALRFLWSMYGVPLEAIDHAKGILGVVEAEDEFGILIWRLPGRRDNE